MPLPLSGDQVLCSSALPWPTAMRKAQIPWIILAGGSLDERIADASKAVLKTGPSYACRALSCRNTCPPSSGCRMMFSGPGEEPVEFK